MALRFISLLGLCVAGSLAVQNHLRIDAILNGEIIAGGSVPSIEGTHPDIISLYYYGRHHYAWTVPTTSRIAPTFSWRVIGGGPAPEGAYPYIISLQYNGRHNCGGSIVSKNYVVTAAHCVQGSSASSLTIKAGINKLTDPGHVRQVLKINYHEDYDPYTIFNDVAILEVEEIDLTLPKISTIRAETKFVQGDEPVALAGWGSTRLGGATPNDLQQIFLKTISVEDCQAAHGKSRIRDTQICSLTKAGEGGCHGDSGGPLVRRVEDHDRLVGIVSWGTPCARGKPDVYGRVSSFVPWFNNKCNNCLN